MATIEIDYSKSMASVLVICIALLVLAIAKETIIPIYICLLIGISALISTWVADKIHWAWMKLAWILSLIFPPILMGLVFYLLLTPIALLAKLFSKKDSLRLKRNQTSTFIDKAKAFEKADFSKTW